VLKPSLRSTGSAQSAAPDERKRSRGDDRLREAIQLVFFSSKAGLLRSAQTLEAVRPSLEGRPGPTRN
jgi:hypothetical protein